MALSGDVLKAVEAVKAGKDPAAEVYGEGGLSGDDSVIVADQSDVQPLSTDSTLDELAPADDSASDSNEEVSAEDADSDASTSDESKSIGKDQEEIWITDDTGRKKVTVDYSDKEKIKRAFKMAYGMRKYQAERDSARKELESLKTSGNEAKRHWDSVEKAYAKDGIRGLINLVEGDDQAYDRHIQAAVDRHDFRRTASQEEIELMDAREREQSRLREAELLRKENEEFRKKMEQEREEAVLQSMQATVNPVFEKYRFAGKLGSADDEHMFDEMLWNSSLKELETFEEQGATITRELVEKVMRKKSTALRNRINVQAEQKVKKVVSQRKQEATENAQRQVMRGYTDSSTAKEARDLISAPGGLTKLIQGWDKYGKVFGNKK